MQDVDVVIGAGKIGQAIARRVGIGKQVLLAAAAEEPPPNVIRFSYACSLTLCLCQDKKACISCVSQA